MKTMKLGGSDLIVPRIAVGCMRLARLSQEEAERFIKNAIEMGANFFDHADIYNGGECETLFANAARFSLSEREKVILQSKCGIVPGVMYDFSYEHIIRSVDGILSRLQTEYLDVLLLHRPDALCEPEEVARAFDCLQESGKVRHFGVSNHSVLQIELLKRAVRQPIMVNQLQLSVLHAGLITGGVNVNTREESGTPVGLLDTCRLQDITVQPWSPLQSSDLDGVFLDDEKYPELNSLLNQLGGQYGVSAAAIAIAWLLRHPAGMQPVTGTVNPEHLRDCVKATEITLTRREWYAITLAAGHTLP